MAESVYLGSVWASFDLKAEAFNRGVKAVERDLEKLDKNFKQTQKSTTDLDHHVNRTTFVPLRRELDSTENAISRFRRSMSETANGIRSLQVAFQGFRVAAMVGAIAILAGGLIQVIGALVAASGALLVLPTAAAVAGAAFAVLKIGTIGVGDAMKAVADGDAKDLAEALKKLSPNAREFVESFSKVREAFKPIQQAVQDKLFFNLGAGIEAVTAKSLPALEAGLGSVAKALNMMAQEALVVMTQPMFNGLLATTLTTTTAVFDNFRRTIAPLIGILNSLVSVGAPYIIQLSEFIAKGLLAGEAFLSSERGMKGMKNAIDTGIIAIKQIWGLVSELTKALFNLFEVSNASGSNLITTLTEMLKKFNAFLDSAEGSAKMRNLFELLNKVFYNSLRVIAFIGDKILELVTAIEKLPKPVQDAIAMFIAIFTVSTPLILFITRLIGSFIALIPVIKLIASVLSKLPALLGLVGAAFTLFAKVVRIAFLVIRLALLGLAANPVVLAIIAIILVIAGLAYLIIKNWDAVKGFFVGLWQTIVTQIQNARNTIVAAWQGVHAGVMVILTAIKNFIVLIWQSIYNFIAGIIMATYNNIVMTWQSIWAFLQPLLNFIKNLFIIVFGGILLGIIYAVKAMYDYIVSTWQAVWSFLQPILQGIWDFIVTVFNAISETIGSIMSSIWEFITATWNAIWVTISSVMTAIWGTIVSIWQSIYATISSVVSSIYSVVSSIWNAIRGFIANVVSNILSVVSNGFNAARNAAANAFNSMHNAVANTMNGVLNTISNIINNIFRMFSNAGSWLVNAGANIIAGLINGMASMVGRLFSYAQSIADGIRTRIQNALNIRSPSRVMMEVGRLIAMGLAVGMDRMQNTVARSATALANQAVPKATMAGLPGLSNSRGSGGNSGGSVTIYGDINIGSEVDADRFLRRFTRNSELTQQRLTPQ